MKARKEVLFERVPHIRKTVPGAVSDNKSRKRSQKRFCIVLKRKMRAAQVAPALPYIKVELYMEQKKEVTDFRYFGYADTGYAICPNCGYALEREYQKYCDQCGQLLGWKKFGRGEFTVQRVTGLNGQRENAIRPKKPGKYKSAPICPK